MVKIEAKKLVEFINMASLNGKFESIVMKFEKDGVHVQSKDEDNSIMNLVFMPSESFELYKEFEKPIGIKSSNMFINISKSFTGIINVNITDDLLTLYNDKKSASLKTANVLYLDNNNLTVIPPIFDKFDAGVKLASEVLRDAVKNISIVNSDNVYLDVKNKILTIRAGNKGFDEISEKVSCEYIDVLSNFNSELFKNVVAVLPDNVILSLPKDGFPVQLISKTDVLNSRLLIAPNNQEEPEVVSKESNIIVGEIKKGIKEEATPITTNTTIEDLTETKKEENSDLL